MRTRGEGEWYVGIHPVCKEKPKHFTYRTL
jgi:hypothetical protein